MAELKTKPTGEDVLEFIDRFADSERKKEDSRALLQLMQQTTGHEPKMWGASMIGFGQYHYKSERSRQEGDWPLVGLYLRQKTRRYQPRNSPKTNPLHGGDPPTEVWVKAGIIEFEGYL